MVVKNFIKHYRGWLMRSALVITLLFGGCTAGIDTPYRIVEHFPIEKELSGEPLRELEDCIGMIDIGTAGPYLICKEHKTEYHFALYDASSQSVEHWGRKGRGPGEYLAPIYYGQNEQRDSVVRFYLWERSLCELQAVDIAREGDSILLHIASRFKMPLAVNVKPRILVRNGVNSFFGVEDGDECRFFTSDSTFRNPVFANQVLSFKNLLAYELSQSCYGLKPDNSRIAIAYFCLPQIDIRKSDGEIVQTIFLNRIVQPRELDLSEHPLCFRKVDADDQYIYALCDDSDTEASARNSILVFDWEGNPIAKYNIPQADSFAIDKKSNRIIAVNTDQARSVCSVYSLM